MEGYRPKARKTKLLVQELPDEVLIYDMERNEAHCLNGTAARVWAFCDGQKTVSEIARTIGSDLAPDAADTLVWSALDQFAERHLLEEEPANETLHSPPQMMTRRQMVVRLGLTVGLALPVVESIVSPPAALATSGGCTSSGSSGSTCV